MNSRGGQWGDQQQPALDPKLQTPGGRWVKRDIDIHRCNKPEYSETVRTGDQWECGACHKVWECKVDGDQRDHSTWLTWTEVNAILKFPHHPPGVR